MADDAVTIRVRATTAEAQRAFKDLKGEVAGLKGSLIPLATAAVPLAAAFAPIAVKAGAAGLAVGVFGAAVAGQVGNLTSAADAQGKYNDAVVKYGKNSQQAIAAQKFVADTMKSMPAATQRASAGLQTLKDDFKSWSDSMATFTMVPVERSFAVLGQVIPKLTPMAKGASTELNRLVAVAGGAVASPGFDALTKKVSTFANQSLKDAVDGAIHFERALSEGSASGPIKTFMEYAEKNGPALRETLHNVGDAVMTLVQASSEAGPGMLTLVNAAAKLVASMPPELVATLMQTAVALKALRLAGAGFAALSTGVQMFSARLAALSAASTAAGGGMAGLRAAFASLGTAAKATVVVAGIAAVVTVLSKLGDLGREAPPNVDRLTTSLGKLGHSGKASGEAARLFGDDLGKLYDSVRNITDPAVIDDIQNGLVKVFSLGIADSTPSKDARKRLDAIDEGLTTLVRGGKADEAASAFKRLSAAYSGDGKHKLSDFTHQMDDYKAALADVKFEQQLAADGMGLFGQQALSTQTALDAQKASADGLRQSIQALNDVQRAGLGGMIGFEAAIDAAAKAAKDDAGALSMSHGQLDLNSEKARNAASALSDLAAQTDAAAAASRESTGSWSQATEIYERGRAKLIESAQAMGLTKKEAEQLARQILKTPDKTAMLRGDIKDLQEKIATAKEKLKHATPSQTAKIKANIADLQRKLGQAQAAIWGLKGRTITVQVRTAGIAAAQAAIAALGGIPAMPHAAGGLVRRASGGPVQAFPGGGLVEGPGTSTSDSITALMGSGAAAQVSDTEYVVQSAAVKKYGVPLLDALNAGQLKLAGFAKGGHLSKRQKAAQARAKAQADAENQARHDAMNELTISRFGHMAGYKRSEFGSALAKPDSLSSLVNSLNQWRGIIAKSTHGGQEKFLLKALDSAGKKLLGWEKQLTKVTASLEKARDKLNSLKDAAASLSASVKGGVLSSANITRGAGGEAPVTTHSVMAGLTSSRDKAASFASALKQLQKKGLSKDLLQQIAEAGIEGGGLETAGALLGASSSEIKSMNKLQGQIGASASSAGKTTADAVYKDAIARQTTIVKALGHQQAKLTTAMDNLTKSLEKLVQAALGKKSKPGKAAGGIVGAAASGGMRGGLTWVGEHEPELLDLPAGSRVWSGPDSRRKAAAPWASMLNAPRGGGGRAPGAGGGSMQPVVVHQTITLDGKVIARQIFDPLRAEIAHRGGSVQRSLGQGAG